MKLRTRFVIATVSVGCVVNGLALRGASPEQVPASKERPAAVQPTDNSAVLPPGAFRVTNPQVAPPPVAPAKSGINPDEKAAEEWEIQSGVTQKYAKAIAGLRLSQKDHDRLYALLLERSRVAYDARDVLNERRSRDPSDYPRYVELAQAEIDREIAASFPPAVASAVMEMIASWRQLHYITNTLDPLLEQAGRPLPREKVLPLALLLYRTFDAKQNPGAVAKARVRNPATGLSVLDELVLEKAASLLDGAQLEALRSALIAQRR